MSLSRRKSNVRPNEFAAGQNHPELRTTSRDFLAGLMALSKFDKRLVALKLLDNKSDRQIARQLGMSPTRLKQKLDEAIETVVTVRRRTGNKIRVQVQKERAAATPSWTPAKANRRAELVDKDIDGTLTPEERPELEQLQQEMRAYCRAVAPLPIEAARALHAQLLSDIETSR